MGMNASQARDRSNLLSRNPAFAAPVANRGFGRKAQPFAQRLGATGGGNGPLKPGTRGVVCVHASDSASRMHLPSSAKMHRQARLPCALSVPMEQLILGTADHRAAFGARLRAVIDALEQSQANVARSIGVTKENLGNWLRGDSYPSMHPVYKFCRIYGVTADWLVLGDPSGLRSDVRDRLLSLAQAPERPSATGRKVHESS
jgi:transcriptional regulator with XRE-family HTH domain